MSTANQIDIDWKWWDAQTRTLKALNSGDYDLVVYRGGYGAGKTILGTRWIIQTALERPKSDNLILAPDSQKGAPATYKTFFQQLPGQDTVPDEGGDPENSPIVENYHGTKRRCTLVNGAIIRLGSADRWNRYAGSEFNAIYGDEVAHYENTSLYKLHRMTSSRQRTEQGPNVMLWTSTGNGFNDFYDITERQVNAEGEPLSWADYMRVIVADSRDNPFLNEREKYERMYADTQSEEQALGGGFAAAEGLVYKQFSRQTHVVDAEKIGDSIQVSDAFRIYGYDAGWNDARVMLEIGKTSYDQYICLDHFYEYESQIEDVADPNEPGGTYLYDKPKGVIHSEHEPAHIDKFRRAGWKATKADKNISAGIEHIRGLLKSDGEGRPGLLVSDVCTELIKEFVEYKEDDVGTKGATDHALDALRYALFTHETREHQKPKPVFGRDY